METLYSVVSLNSSLCNKSYNKAFQRASSPSPHCSCTNFNFSTDLHIPLQLQSNEAIHTLPACAFQSQSANKQQKNETMLSTKCILEYIRSLSYLWNLNRKVKQQDILPTGITWDQQNFIEKDTWWSATTHIAFVDVLNFKADKPRTKRHVFISIFVQYGPINCNHDYLMSTHMFKKGSMLYNTKLLFSMTPIYQI